MKKGTKGKAKLETAAKKDVEKSLRVMMDVDDGTPIVAFYLISLASDVLFSRR